MVWFKISTFFNLHPLVGSGKDKGVDEDTDGVSMGPELVLVTFLTAPEAVETIVVGAVIALSLAAVEADCVMEALFTVDGSEDEIKGNPS